jgi:hypothetical protein
MEKYMKALTMLALALAAVGASPILPAAAQTSASAGIQELDYRLIDLNPDDGITPWIVFGDSWSNSAASIANLDKDIMQQLQNEKYGALNFNTVYGSGGTLTSSTSASAFVNAQSGTADANTVNALYFSLSPNTQLLFTGNGYASAVFNLGYGNASANATMVGTLSDDVGNLASATARVSALGGANSGPMLIALTSQGSSMYGSVTMQVTTRAMSIAEPVPEPASAAMLLAGGGMLAALARRRRKAA